ncbi:hypothetical protein Q5P01_004416 [Channa striata]|uniref:DUF4708 domain-containing protein n=1 Tax=Channa striata TaxID=64152 RepID=A0AA88NLK7_CHASR|nr:hypothetical protein Q5P01_004416 [Channa striata]
MSGGVQQLLFFLRLPDLKKLLFITLSLQGKDAELRTKQIKICRELVLLYSDILASPALDSFNDITVVMPLSFFQKGILPAYAQRHHLQLGSPQCVLPGVLQCCLSYSLITRLAPSWNKAGLYLISGKDFLTEKGRMDAVSMELSTTEGQLCISIAANSVRMPPTTLQDFDLPPLLLKRFNSDPDFTLDPSSTGAVIWCHVLPSMKKGQIISISHQLPSDGPFRTYRDLQNHWTRLYGYRLPEVTEEEVYCSVYFRLVGERLFTYPLSCIRLQPVQRCPGGNLEGVLGSFLSDIRTRLQSVCGFPAHLTSRPCYHTVSLKAAATVKELSAEWVNLSTSSTTRQVLTQLPAPPPHRMLKPFFGSQPPPWTPLSQQDKAQGLTQAQRGGEDTNRPSSSSSSSRVSNSSNSQTPLSLLQPASSLTCSTSSFPLPPPSQPPGNPAKPKLVPVFKSKRPLSHSSVDLLRLQKQQQQRSGNMESKRKVIIPPFGKNKPTTAPLACSSAFLPVPPAAISARLKTKTQCGFAPQPSAQLKHIFSLSRVSKSKPGLIPPSVPESRSDSNTVTKSRCKPPAASPEAPQLLPSYVGSNKDYSGIDRGGPVLESQVKNSRTMTGDMDEEKTA